MSEKILLTVKEVAVLLHTNVNYVYRLINSGILPALKLGSFKIRKEVLLKFIEDNEGKDLTNPENVKALLSKKTGDNVTRFLPLIILSPNYNIIREYSKIHKNKIK